MRAALYARFSTDNQRPASIEDQLRGCRRLAGQLGADIVDVFTDEAVSGYAEGNRPGMQALMAGARRGLYDVVVVEHQNRLARSGTGTFRYFEELRALGIAIQSVEGGRATTMSTGVAALVSAVQLEETSFKTRRALEGIAGKGRNAGGRAYGYKVKRELLGDGTVTTGALEIDEAEAAVVRRVHREYAAGASPRAIVARLNADGVPGPRGGPWNASTLNGNRDRGNGLLNNELYRGVMVWGRQSWTKDPGTGKRLRARAPALEQPIRREVPALRIVDEALWLAVKARQAETEHGPQARPEAARRPVKLLSGLVRCGGCGGPMTVSGPGGRLLCSRKREQGPTACANGRTAVYAEVEAKVLATVKRDLLHPELIELAAAEYRRLMAEARRSASSQRADLERELGEITRKASRLIDQVADGVLAGDMVADKIKALQARKDEVEQSIASIAGDDNVVEAHPNAGQFYRRAIEQLETKLAATDAVEVAEAREQIRALVLGVHVIPEEGRGTWRVEIDSDAARLLMIGETSDLGQRWVRGRAPPVALTVSIPLRLRA